MNINTILHHCALTDSDEKRWGDTPPKKGKGRDILIIFPKSVMLWICFYPKFLRVGNGSPSGLKVLL